MSEEIRPVTDEESDLPFDLTPEESRWVSIMQHLLNKRFNSFGENHDQPMSEYLANEFDKIDHQLHHIHEDIADIGSTAKALVDVSL